MCTTNLSSAIATTIRIDPVIATACKGYNRYGKMMTCVCVDSYIIPMSFLRVTKSCNNIKLFQTKQNKSIYIRTSCLLSIILLSYLHIFTYPIYILFTIQSIILYHCVLKVVAICLKKLFQNNRKQIHYPLSLFTSIS